MREPPFPYQSPSTFTTPGSFQVSRVYFDCLEGALSDGCSQQPFLLPEPILRVIGHQYLAVYRDDLACGNDIFVLDLESDIKKLGQTYAAWRPFAIHGVTLREETVTVSFRKLTNTVQRFYFSWKPNVSLACIQLVADSDVILKVMNKIFETNHLLTIFIKAKKTPVLNVPMYLVNSDAKYQTQIALHPGQWLEVIHDDTFTASVPPDQTALQMQHCGKPLAVCNRDNVTISIFGCQQHIEAPVEISLQSNVLPMRSILVVGRDRPFRITQPARLVIDDRRDFEVTGFTMFATKEHQKTFKIVRQKKYLGYWIARIEKTRTVSAVNINLEKQLWVIG